MQGDGEGERFGLKRLIADLDRDNGPPREVARGNLRARCARWRVRVDISQRFRVFQQRAGTGATATPIGSAPGDGNVGGGRETCEPYPKAADKTWGRVSRLLRDEEWREQRKSRIIPYLQPS